MSRTSSTHHSSTNPLSTLPQIHLSTGAQAAIAASTVAFIAVAVLWHAKRNNTLIRRYAKVSDLPEYRVNKKGTGQPLRLSGYAVHVGDSDGFRFYHTPSLRNFQPPPKSKSANFTDTTITVRIAGTDCPEAAHFGMNAQPWSFEAYQYTLSCLMPGATIKPGTTKFLRGRPMTRRQKLESAEYRAGQPGRVKIEIYRKDQYDRAVAMVWYRPYPRLFPFYWSNLSLDLLSKGLGVVYTQAGAEYGGIKHQFDRIQGKAQKRQLGIWSSSGVTTPSQHKKQFK